jgi:hypothetical protein
LAKRRTAGSPNWQERATEFKVGDRAFPFFTDEYHGGTVVAVWPAIGMVDVQFPQGNMRMPVEELQRGGDDPSALPPAVEHDSVPGGARTVPVSPGPHAESASRVARAYVKKALYWAAVDRKYRATKGELDSGSYKCPRCRQDHLKKAIYKRTEGASDRLYGCPSCLFLIKRCDILGDPDYVDPSDPFTQVGG